MSWKAEVIADNSGEWCGNGLRFASKVEAEQYAADLAWRWTAVRETRVVESDDPVTERRATAHEIAKKLEAEKGL